MNNPRYAFTENAAYAYKVASYAQIRSFIRPRRKHVDQAVQLAPKSQQPIARRGKVVA
jgi:hypothetical protein